ncbi:MAG: YceI family protein [Bacteroidia bacterium]|nr:YceI family protein [Bacteroidia bacterium]
MKKIILAATVVILLVGSAFTISVLWKADEKTSTVNFELPGSDKKGTFGNLVSTIDFDKKKLKDSKITASIDVSTLKAGNEKLEAHLLSPDFFDATKFPKITFTSTAITKTDTGFVAKGNLTMKDSTKVIDLPFTFKEIEKNKGTFSGVMTVNAAEYGVMKANKAGKDKVLIYLVVPVTK